MEKRQKNKTNMVEDKPTRLRSRINFVLTEADCEKPRGLSVTIPGESMTIKKMMERALAGMPVNQFLRRGQDADQATLDFDSPDMEEAARLELVERMQLYEEAVEKVNRIEKAAIKRKEEQSRAAIEKAVEERIKALAELDREKSPKGL